METTAIQGPALFTEKLSIYLKLVDLFLTIIQLHKNKKQVSQHKLAKDMVFIGVKLSLVAPDEITRTYYTWKELSIEGGVESIKIFGELLLCLLMETFINK